MKLGVELLGLDKALSDITALGERGRHAAEATMFAVAQDVLDMARPNIPVLSGATRDSGFATRTVPVEMGFGGPAFRENGHSYPVIVHERATGRGFKFLQRAVNEWTNSASGALARTFERALREGWTLQSVVARYPTSAVGTRRRRAISARAGMRRRSDG